MDQSPPTPSPDAPAFRALRSRWQRCGAIVLVLAVAAWATAQLWTLHTRDLRLRQAEDRLLLVETAITSGDAAQARRFLASLDNNDAVNSARLEAVAEQCGRLERCTEFLRQARAVRAGGAHLIDPAAEGDPVTRACTHTLATLGVLDNPMWTREFDRVPCWAEVRHEAAALLTLLAMRRLAENDPEGMRASARAALDYLRQADQLRAPGHASWATQRAAYRRLADHAQADALNAICAAEAPQSADDFYAAGFLAEQVRVEELSPGEAYRRALKAEPGHYAAHVGRFSLARRQADLQGQVMALTACLALRPAEACLFFHRGLARFRLDDYPGALDDWNANLQLRPNDAACHFWRGRVLFLAGHWHDADQDFSAALGVEGKPDMPALAWRALARARLGRHRDAADDAEQALKLRADAETAWFAARAYSLCVRATRDVPDSRERQDTAEHYGARSVSLLRQAVALGLARNSEQRQGLRASPDLDPVRARRDFEDLLRTVDERE